MGTPPPGTVHRIVARDGPIKSVGELAGLGGPIGASGPAPPGDEIAELAHECLGPGPAPTWAHSRSQHFRFRAVITRRVVTRSSNSTAPPTIRT